MVDYELRVLSHDAHLFEVRCSVERPDPTGQRFSLPVWTPGSYLIREFARHVIGARGESNGRALEVEKIDKQTWQCAATDAPVTFIYEVYAFDLSVRGAYLDRGRGFVNGAAVFVWAHGFEQHQASLRIIAPAQSDWRVATAMPAVEIDTRGFGSYRSADYDELIDHPIELGDFVLQQFEIQGVGHQIAITGAPGDTDFGRLTADVARVCHEHIRLFGAAPFERYLFQLLVVGDGYGGLEHRASTSLIASRKTLPRVGFDTNSEDYRTLFGLFSHEYFHAWNVKRIKPAAFVPYDLTREAFTRDLWVYEGITSYYDDLALVRAGVIDEGAYLELLAQTITRVLRGAGRLKQSVAESSFDAWIKFYRPDENAPNSLVSYYAKGSLIALMLDLILRSETTVSLDHVMRALWQRYGQTCVGVPEGRFEALVEALAGAGIARRLRAAISGTDDVPLEQLFAQFGIAMQVRAADSADDKGGKPGKNGAARVSLGVRAEGKSDPKLVHVYDDGAAQAAGLAPGDQLMALNGLRITEGLDAALKYHRVGARVNVHAFRRDQLFETQVQLKQAPIDTCWLEIASAETSAQRALRQHWLSPVDDDAG